MFDDLERLRQLGVRAVVNLCAERPDNPHRLRRAQMDYLWLPVTDTHAPTVDQILQGLAWLEQRVQPGRKVYIHCAAGMGRSSKGVVPRRPSGVGRFGVSRKSPYCLCKPLANCRCRRCLNVLKEESSMPTSLSEKRVFWFDDHKTPIAELRRLVEMSPAGRRR